MTSNGSFNTSTIAASKSSSNPSAFPSAQLSLASINIELNNVSIQANETGTMESITNEFKEFLEISSGFSVVQVNAYIDDIFVENRYLQDISTKLAIEIIGRLRNTQSSGFIPFVENLISSNYETLLTSLKKIMPTLSSMNLTGVRSDIPSHIPSSSRQPSEEPSESHVPTVTSKQVLSAVVSGAAVSIK